MSGALYVATPHDVKAAIQEAAAADGVTLRLFTLRALELYRGIPPSLRAALERAAARHGRSTAALVTEALQALAGDDTR